MTWKTTSAQCRQQLESALTVAKFAHNLAELPQVQLAGVDSGKIDTLKKEIEQAKRQKERLEKGEFRIAVVGLEKNGKSTFVNAWLGCDLLPAKSGRCTFTTTQIHAVQETEDQRVEVYPKSISEFREYRNELERASSEKAEQAKAAKEDLDTINENLKTLEDVLGKAPKDLNREYTRIEEIKDYLTQYVADKRYAHAIREVHLYTSQLAEAEGVGFYDVPGLDSGLAKHYEESREMLKDCDSVIVLQKKPSLTGPEKDLINFAREGDRHIGLEEKLFVFYGFVDTLGSPGALKDNLEQAQKEWQKICGLDANRIVPGSAGAHLVLHNVAGEQTLKDVGDARKITGNMQHVMGCGEDLDSLKGSTGVAEIKKKINDYLNNERIRLVERRTSAIVHEIMQLCSDICSTTRKVYPLDPDTARRAAEENLNLEFNKWFARQKENIKSETTKYYEEKIAGSLNNSTLIVFRERYDSLVKERMNTLEHRTQDRRDVLFYANSPSGFDAAKVNYKWREKLYDDVRKMIIDISGELSDELVNQSFEFVNFMKNEFWGSDKIEKLVLKNKDHFSLSVTNGLKALFLRFIRAPAEALISGPVGSDLRNEIMERLGVDIELLDPYYPPQDDSKSLLLIKYARHGIGLLRDPNLEPMLGPGVKIASMLLELLTKKLEEQPLESGGGDKSANDKRKLVEEVEADLITLEHYLLVSVFEAAGFKAYCKQELDNLRDNFLSLEEKGIWDHIAHSEFKKGNLKLTENLPSHIRPQEIETEVSDRLRELQTALDNYYNGQSN